MRVRRLGVKWDWQHGLAGLVQTTQAPPVWRAPEGPEGLAAVPVGGGRARAGLEIDHSERSSRVAISRAAGPDGAQNTSGVVSTTGARANRPYSPPPGSGRPV